MLAMPFLEIAGFIVVGSHIGVLATLGLIVLSAVMGFVLLRIQGIGLLQRIKTESASGRVPDRELVHGAMLVMAAILLIVPGFITSLIGLLLFVPFIRDIVWNNLVRGRMVVATSASYSDTQGPRQSNPYTGRNKDIDGRIIDLDPDEFTSKPDGNSPWRKDKDKE